MSLLSEFLSTTSGWRVKSTSDHADSAGSFPGASLSLGGEACHGSELSESEPARRDGVPDGGTQIKRIKFTGETLFGPAEETPTGREAYNSSSTPRSRK